MLLKTVEHITLFYVSSWGTDVRLLYYFQSILTSSYFLSSEYYWFVSAAISRARHVELQQGMRH
jgi:hypothetical protein